LANELVGAVSLEQHRGPLGRVAIASAAGSSDDQRITRKEGDGTFPSQTLPTTIRPADPVVSQSAGLAAG